MSKVISKPQRRLTRGDILPLADYRRCGASGAGRSAR